MLEKFKELAKSENADQIMDWCIKTHPDLWAELSNQLGTRLQPMIVGMILTVYYYEVTSKTA